MVMIVFEGNIAKCENTYRCVCVLMFFRFSPCFFLYICTMIPPIWFMEINRINVKLGIEPINQTEGDELTAMIEKGLISKANLNDKTVSEWNLFSSKSRKKIIQS